MGRDTQLIMASGRCAFKLGRRPAGARPAAVCAGETNTPRWCRAGTVLFGGAWIGVRDRSSRAVRNAYDGSAIGAGVVALKGGVWRRFGK